MRAKVFPFAFIPDVPAINPKRDKATHSTPIKPAILTKQK